MARSKKNDNNNDGYVDGADLIVLSTEVPAAATTTAARTNNYLNGNEPRQVQEPQDNGSDDGDSLDRKPAAIPTDENAITKRKRKVSLSPESNTQDTQDDSSDDMAVDDTRFRCNDHRRVGSALTTDSAIAGNHQQQQQTRFRCNDHRRVGSALTTDSAIAGNHQQQQQNNNNESDDDHDGEEKPSCKTLFIGSKKWCLQIDNCLKSCSDPSVRSMFRSTDDCGNIQSGADFLPMDKKRSRKVQKIAEYWRNHPDVKAALLGGSKAFNLALFFKRVDIIALLCHFEEHNPEYVDMLSKYVDYHNERSRSPKEIMDWSIGLASQYSQVKEIQGEHAKKLESMRFGQSSPYLLCVKGHENEFHFGKAFLGRIQDYTCDTERGFQSRKKSFLRQTDPPSGVGYGPGTVKGVLFNYFGENQLMNPTKRMELGGADPKILCSLVQNTVEVMTGTVVCGPVSLKDIPGMCMYGDISFRQATFTFTEEQIYKFAKLFLRHSKKNVQGTNRFFLIEDPDWKTLIDDLGSKITDTRSFLDIHFQKLEKDESWKKILERAREEMDAVPKTVEYDSRRHIVVGKGSAKYTKLGPMLKLMDVVQSQSIRRCDFQFGSKERLIQNREVVTCLKDQDYEFVTFKNKDDTGNLVCELVDIYEASQVVGDRFANFRKHITTQILGIGIENDEDFRSYLESLANAKITTEASSKRLIDKLFEKCTPTDPEKIATRKDYESHQEKLTGIKGGDALNQLRFKLIDTLIEKCPPTKKGDVPNLFWVKVGNSGNSLRQKRNVNARVVEENFPGDHPIVPSYTSDSIARLFYKKIVDKIIDEARKELRSGFKAVQFKRIGYDSENNDWSLIYFLQHPSSVAKAQSKISTYFDPK